MDSDAAKTALGRRRLEFKSRCRDPLLLACWLACLLPPREMPPRRRAMLAAAAAAKSIFFHRLHHSGESFFFFVVSPRRVASLNGRPSGSPPPDLTRVCTASISRLLGRLKSKAFIHSSLSEHETAPAGGSRDQRSTEPPGIREVALC